MWQNNRKNIFTRPFWRSLEREKNCCQYRKSHLLKHHRNTQHNMRAFLISLKCRVVCSLHSSHREANQWATIYLQTHERCRGGIQNEHYISRWNYRAGSTHDLVIILPNGILKFKWCFSFVREKKKTLQIIDHSSRLLGDRTRCLQPCIPLCFFLSLQSSYDVINLSLFSTHYSIDTRLHRAPNSFIYTNTFVYYKINLHANRCVVDSRKKWIFLIFFSANLLRLSQPPYVYCFDWPQSTRTFSYVKSALSRLESRQRMQFDSVSLVHVQAEWIKKLFPHEEKKKFLSSKNHLQSVFRIVCSEVCLIVNQHQPTGFATLLCCDVKATQNT